MKKSQGGFSLTELLIGMTLGIVVLASLMLFFFKSTKMISQQQDVVKDIAQLQFFMNRIAEDIKDANTQPPTASTTITTADWALLPSLCYTRPFNMSGSQPLCQPALTTYPKEYPTFPIAYQFQWQSGKETTVDGWYPKPDPANPTESNQLAFYKVTNGLVSRVLYYTEIDPTNPVPNSSDKIYRLRRRQQFNIIATSTNYVDATLQSADNIVISNLKFIQFTYPALLKRLETTSPDYDSAFSTKLLDINTNETDASKRPYLQSELLNPLRNSINIKIAIAGPIIGNKPTTAFDLTTEVSIRN